MRKTGWLTIMILFVPLLNCSSVSVNTDFDQSANFDNLQTYEWMATSEEKKKGRIKDKRTLKLIRSAIDKQLNLKGYQKGNENPDFFVASRASIVGKASASNAPRRGPNRGLYRLEEGSLIIDILNPGTGKAIWWGSGKIIVGAKDDPETGARQIDELVQSILKEFPPKGK